MVRFQAIPGIPCIFCARNKGQRCIEWNQDGGWSEGNTCVVVFPKPCFFCIGKFHHLVKSFKQEITVLKKGRDEESVDKTVLQKYHRGRQNRFKVSSCFLKFHWNCCCLAYVLLSHMFQSISRPSEFKRQETARETQVVRVTVSTSCGTGR